MDDQRFVLFFFILFFELSHRKVSQEDGMKLAKELKCIFVETSAKTNTNVEAIFAKLIEEVEGKILNKKFFLFLDT